MALSNKQILRKLKKMRMISKKFVVTFTPAQYRMVAERERIMPVHLEDMNEIAHADGFFLFQSKGGNVFFGRDENFRPVVLESAEEIDEDPNLNV